MPTSIATIAFKHLSSWLSSWHLIPLSLGIVGLSKGARQAEPARVAERAVAPVPFLPREQGDAYMGRLNKAWAGVDWPAVEQLSRELLECWRTGHQVFLCGNGGSAANAVHLANDLLYGIDKPDGRGMRVTALPANAAVMTCLGNDTSYAEIFSRQLEALACRDDLLIAFSGSGNSPNVLEALRTARKLGMRSHAVLGYKGGESQRLADNPIHFAIDDMQVSEDLQMMVGHMICQWLHEQRKLVHP